MGAFGRGRPARLDLPGDEIRAVTAYQLDPAQLSYGQVACTVCGALFSQRRPGAKACSDRCRVVVKAA